MDDRALSTALSYALLLGVTVMLMGGLSVAAGGLLESQHERAVEAELDVIGERVTADLQTADRLTHTAGETESLAVRSSSPQLVSGGHYTIDVVNGGEETTLVVESADVDVTTETTVPTTTPVAETTVIGGELEITYDSESDELVIANG
ncbi:hypothetical protein EA462_07420 [Natrarchaeobius halalkaliphilus]|uniref:Secreted glycoprotein n=1 Tax=Natrarchaeobius halalkaliphilus TaxID=1679091 RepID=A0A3N6NYE3_9EURY|nr:hypothetical protein [Natrarchaeobius halalkaliphilus]RQG89839.1 hypothetical protein EA462_07420 [Natrarchaeobius halalkaliphilus]